MRLLHVCDGRHQIPLLDASGHGEHLLQIGPMDLGLAYFRGQRGNPIQRKDVAVRRANGQFRDILIPPSQVGMKRDPGEIVVDLVRNILGGHPFQGGPDRIDGDVDRVAGQLYAILHLGYLSPQIVPRAASAGGPCSPRPYRIPIHGKKTTTLPEKTSALPLRLG
jgi:hypothetical protein